MEPNKEKAVVLFIATNSQSGPKNRPQQRHQIRHLQWKHLSCTVQSRNVIIGDLVGVT